MQTTVREQHLFGLGVLTNLIHWVEELLNTTNGLILMAGAGIAVVDLLTDGALAHALPWVVFVWAVSQAVGIEVQLLGSFARARQAQREGTHSAMVGWLLLGMVLLGTTVLASYVYAIVRVQGITTAAALAELGISNFAFLGLRACLAAGLVALAGWTRYVGHTKALDTAGERAKLEHELDLEPLRARVRAQKLKSLGVAARGAVSGFTGHDEQQDDGGKREGENGTTETADEAVGNVVPIKPGKKGKRVVPEAVVEAKIRRLLAKSPNMPLNELMHKAGVSLATASTWKKLIRAEMEQVG